MNPLLDSRTANPWRKPSRLITGLLGFFLISFYQIGLGQNIDQNWIFGFGGGYDWTNNSTVTNSSIASYEGCASISDAAGNLIFYSDGINAWDASHNLVTTGFDMFGHPSSTQSGVIIPKPGTSDYYILAVDYRGTVANHQSRMGYYEASVSGGTLVNVFPANGNILLTNSSEKIAAVRKPCDPDTIWVIAHDFTGGFYEVFAATNSGIASTGRTINDQYGTYTDPKKVGVLRFNHDGTMLASAVFDQHIEMMGFDPFTGQFVGTPLNFPVTTTGYDDKQVYGLEFSPDNNTLYATITGSGLVQHNSLWQYDVSVMNTAAIEASRTLIVDYGQAQNDYQPGQMQLAPDGNIYVAMWYYETTPGSGTGFAYLGQITNPNIGGPGNFNGTAIQGPAGNQDWSTRGLPTFLTETFTGTAPVIDICNGNSAQLQAPAGSGYNWSPATDLSCTSCANPVASPTADITYTLQYIDNNGDCQIITHPITVSNCNSGCDALNLTANFSYQTNSSVLEVRDLSSVLAPDQISYIEWNFDDGDGWEAASPGTNSLHSYSLEGTYEVCLHAAVFISPDECCHDTICQTITVLFDTCSHYVADFAWEQVVGSQEITFEDTTSPASDISIWDFGDGMVQTTSGTSHGSFTHTYAAPGTYDVTLVAIDHIDDTLCCIDTMMRRVTVLAPSAFRVGPTLVEDHIEIQVLVDQTKEYQLKIFNPAGKVWLSEKGLINGKHRLDLNELDPGVYFIELSDGERHHLKKFVKF